MPSLQLRYTPLPHEERLPPTHIFTDGSFDPPSDQMGSAVILPEGQAAIFKPPGKGSSYVAELFALALGTLLCPPHSHIFSDSQGALAAIRGSSPRVLHSYLVGFCRTNVSHKHLRLSHIKGHRGIKGNELADRYAKKAARTIPPLPPQALRSSLDIRYHGRLQRPPPTKHGPDTSPPLIRMPTLHRFHRNPSIAT